MTVSEGVLGWSGAVLWLPGVRVRFLGALKATAGCCRHNRALCLGLMNRPVLATSDLSAEDQARIEDEDARCDWEQSRDIVENGPFAPGDTTFAMGHYSEDRLVEFDYLVVTLGDIMRECAIPEDQREKQRLISRSATEYFVQFYDGPERTASSSGGCSLVDCRGGGGCASCVVVVA